MSSSFWWNNKDFNNIVMKNKTPENIEFYLDSGNQGPSKDGMQDTITVKDHMRTLGFVLGNNLFLLSGQWRIT